MTEVNFKYLSTLASKPERKSEFAAGYDLCAAINCTTSVFPGQTKKIPTDIAVELPENTFGAVFPRSGLATNQGLRLANSVAVIDPDYRGGITVAIHNDSQTERVINPGDRIAQLVIIPFVTAEFNEVDELSETARGEGGFGSTGV